MPAKNSQPVSTHIRYPTTTSKKRMSTIMVSKYKVSKNRTLVIVDIDADLQKKVSYLDDDYYYDIVNDWQSKVVLCPYIILYNVDKGSRQNRSVTSGKGLTLTKDKKHSPFFSIDNKATTNLDLIIISLQPMAEKTTKNHFSYSKQYPPSGKSFLLDKQ